MTIDRQRLNIQMARACYSVSDLFKKSDISKNTLKAAMSGKNLKPKTVGKIAKALNCDVADILEEV